MTHIKLLHRCSQPPVDEADLVRVRFSLQQTPECVHLLLDLLHIQLVRSVAALVIHLPRNFVETLSRETNSRAPTLGYFRLHLSARLIRKEPI